MAAYQTWGGYVAIARVTAPGFRALPRLRLFDPGFCHFGAILAPGDSVDARFEILLYDLTSTYFECDPPEHGKRTFTVALNRKKLRQVRGREGRYLLRSNLTGDHPVQLWIWYIQLTEVEQAFKELTGDLSIRPIYHQLDTQIEAHRLKAFLAYCLQVTLKARLRPLAPGLTPRAVLEKFAAIQMVDVYRPTTDGRTLILSCHTEPEPEQHLLLERLRLQLPPQPPLRITAAPEARLHLAPCSASLSPRGNPQTKGHAENGRE